MLYLILLAILSSCTLKDQKVRNMVPELVELKEIVCLVDSTDALEIEDVAKNPQLFKPYAGPELNYGHLRKALWVKLTFENKTDIAQKFYISSDQVILEDVRFFSKTAEGWNIEKSAWGLAASKKKTDSYLHAFPLEFLPKETKTYFVRIRNQYQVVRYPIHIFSEVQFYQHSNFYVFLDGLVIMALITSILYVFYNLIFSRKDRILIYYMLYAVNFLAFYAIRIASPTHIAEAHPPLLNYFVTIFIFISTYAFVKFGIRFIDPDKEDKHPIIENIIDVFFVLAILASLFPKYSDAQALNTIKLIFFTGSIAYLIWYMCMRFRKSLLSRIYFFMGMPLIVSGLVEGLTNVFGILKVPNQFFEAFRMSIVIEMLYILFAYIYREKILTAQIQSKLRETELELLRSKIDSQEAEQKRISGDLHDDLGGTLSTLKRLIFDNLIGNVKEIEANKIKKLTQKAADDLRRIAHALMPPEFEISGLTESVKELLKNNNSEKKKIQFLQHGKAHKLHSSIELNIFRIVSEIIQNINKHSKATKVLVQFIWSENELTMMVEDNGSDFKEAHSGLGMKNMKMRAEYIGGFINFDSNGLESTITLEVPINES
ncbi:sensor histidine kinase [Arcticibacterium luteifluviistationis]|uniref:histidine kinase n=1 Tax=Arcticibacterium luteifluviistationis TaxID=1784714 RepID=A0A2Z4G9J0_9BACT|nr:7TM-DISM domain-containing protein [Arcticibacterium luteifluviistationis]AWV97899.1 hypothetical protein DJ013_06850 [Arcticibacterium luteifluviistationis]